MQVPSFILAIHPIPSYALQHVLCLTIILLNIVPLLSPPTPGWKLLRAGIAAPLQTAALVFFCVGSRSKDVEEHWGRANLACHFVMRGLELLVFWPAEENVYRLIPKTRELDSKAPAIPKPSSTGHPTELVAEPVPPPWTRAKLYWATSLFFSFRGIGWNYAPTLSPSSCQHP
jgi:hypothetical protein